MYRTSRHTALLIALLLKRSGKNRIRFSELTLKKLADRERLKGAFVVELQLEAMNAGVVLVELSRGGFGAMWAAALDGAVSVTAKTLIPVFERKKLTEDEIIVELNLPSPDDDDEE